jgi:flagellar protein FlaG
MDIEEEGKMDIESLSSGTNFAVSNLKGANEQVRQKDAFSDEQQKSETMKSEDTLKLSAEQDIKVSHIQADKEEANVEEALAEVSEYVQAKNQNLSFSFDDEANRSVIKVTDSDSGDVIRQIPSEEVLALSERIKNLQTDGENSVGVGVLINKEI